MKTNYFKSELLSCHTWKMYKGNNYESGYYLFDNFSQEAVDISKLPITQELKNQVINEGKELFKRLPNV